MAPTASDRPVATTNGAQTRYPHRQGREELQRYGGIQPRGLELQRYGVRQPRGLELQLLWLSTTTSTIKLRERSDPGERGTSDPGVNRLGPEAASGPRGAGRDWESRSRTTCRLGRDPSTKKNFLRLLKFSNGIRPSSSTRGDYERCSNTVRPRGREKLQRYGGRQPRGLELQRYGGIQPRVLSN
jgi:hypothetical protein